MASSALVTTLKVALFTVGVPSALYVGLIALLVANPSLQAYAVYLHKVTLTWSKNLNVPEQFGFLHNQVVPFYINTDDGEDLHAWHILPLQTYLQRQDEILNQTLSGPVHDATSTLNFRLLKDDPEAILVLYMHGTSGTIGSTIRPTSYRNIYSLANNKIHVLATDYRGYGKSSGAPSEQGLLLDALAILEWATTIAKIPPERIVIYGQSLGSAVTVSLLHHLAMQGNMPSFAGVVISAAFSDLATLTATYRIGGFIPVLAPVSKVPFLFRYFTAKLQDKWLVKDKLAELLQRGHEHHLTIIHADDDSDIPVQHAHDLFWYAVNATAPTPISAKELEKEISRKKVDLGAGGWYVDWNSNHGVVRLYILKYGEHDWQMTYPATSSAILRAIKSKHPAFPSGHDDNALTQQLI